MIDFSFLSRILASFVSTLLNPLQVLRVMYKKKSFDEELFEKIIKINYEGDYSKVVKGNLDELLKSYKSFAIISSVIIHSEKVVFEMIKPKDKEKEVIISTLFLEQKLKKIYKTYLLLVIATILSVVVSMLFQIAWLLTGTIFLLIIMVSIYQTVLNYRIKNGVFGTNSYEAKELIEFIVDNNNKFDGNGNGLFNEEKLTEIIFDFTKLAEERRGLSGV